MNRSDRHRHTAALLTLVLAIAAAAVTIGVRSSAVWTTGGSVQPTPTIEWYCGGFPLPILSLTRDGTQVGFLPGGAKLSVTPASQPDGLSGLNVEATVLALPSPSGGTPTVLHDANHGDAGLVMAAFLQTFPCSATG